MDKICKNCNLFKRKGYTQFGECEVIFNGDRSDPPDADKRILHIPQYGFPFHQKSKVMVGENFGCHFWRKIKVKKEDEDNGA